MAQFKIENDTFDVDENDLADSFVVSSVPRDYRVTFDTCSIGETVNRLLCDKDVLLIDNVKGAHGRLNVDAKRVIHVFMSKYVDQNTILVRNP